MSLSHIKKYFGGTDHFKICFYLTIATSSHTCTHWLMRCSSLSIPTRRKPEWQVFVSSQEKASGRREQYVPHPSTTHNPLHAYIICHGSTLGFVWPCVVLCSMKHKPTSLWRDSIIIVGFTRGPLTSKLSKLWSYVSNDSPQGNKTGSFCSCRQSNCKF